MGRAVDSVGFGRRFIDRCADIYAAVRGRVPILESRVAALEREKTILIGEVTFFKAQYQLARRQGALAEEEAEHEREDAAGRVNTFKEALEIMARRVNLGERIITNQRKERVALAADVLALKETVGVILLRAHTNLALGGFADDHLAAEIAQILPKMQMSIEEKV